MTRGDRQDIFAMTRTARFLETFAVAPRFR